MPETTRKPVEEMSRDELIAELDEYNETAGIAVPYNPKMNRQALGWFVGATRGYETPSAVQGEPEPDQEPDAAEEPDEEPAPHKPDLNPVPVEAEDEVGQAIAVRDASSPSSGLPTPAAYNAMKAIASDLSESRVVPDAYRGRTGDILAAILYGAELGIKPMNALRDVYMIEGRAAIAAHRQLGILRAGGIVLDNERTGADDTRAWITATRTDTGETMSVEFTYEEAEKIKRKGKPLVDGDNWRNYRKDMLWARAVGRLSRRLAPDIMGGLPPYVAEEVADFEGWGIEYGSQGQLVTRQEERNQRRQAMPEYRKEFPDYNWPDGWPELVERLRQAIMITPNSPDGEEWMREALMTAFPGVESLKALNTDDRRVMFQKYSGVLQVLDGQEVYFDNDPRSKIQEAFARFFDGIILAGPAWQVGPNEDDRPEAPTPEPVLEGEVVDETRTDEDRSAEDIAAAEAYFEPGYSPHPDEDPNITF